MVKLEQIPSKKLLSSFHNLQFQRGQRACKKDMRYWRCRKVANRVYSELFSRMLRQEIDDLKHT